MNVVRSLARPMLGWVFVYGGWDALRDPAPRVATAAPLVGRLRESVPGLPGDTTVIRVNAAAQVVGGALLGLGLVPRTSAAVLAASLAPTTLVGHPFWREEAEGRRSLQRTQFNKNLAVLGGLLLAALDIEGRPSVSWWVRRAARRLPVVAN